MHRIHRLTLMTALALVLSLPGGAGAADGPADGPADAPRAAPAPTLLERWLEPLRAWLDRDVRDPAGEPPPSAPVDDGQEGGSQTDPNG